MATLRDVAELAGTSVATASAVLNGTGGKSIRVSQATRARILQAAETLEYRVNSSARSLVTGVHGVIGVVFPYADGFMGKDAFSARCISSILAETIRQRVNIMLHTAAGQDWNALDNTLLLDSRMDGLLLVLPTPQSHLIEHCRRKKIPYVAVVYHSDDDTVFSVNANDFAGGKIATEHLLSLGHRRIAHLRGQNHISTSTPRFSGYLRALEEAGITPDSSLIVSAGFDMQQGYRAMLSLFHLPPEQFPTAVFAANDSCAQGALKALQEYEMQVPGEVALVGYDDSPIAEALYPPLTSVHMPIEEIGTLATQMLIQLINGEEVEERQVVLPVHLVIRASSGMVQPTD